MSPRTILITGASSGIGAALARAYAGPNVRLLLWGRNEKRLEETAEHCRARGAKVETCAFDVGDSDSLVARLEEADATSPIDLAIFNAGLGGSVPKTQLTQSVPSARAMVQVNFLAPVVGGNVMAERMAARGRGQIVFIGSIAESFPLPMAPAYSGTKAGLAMFSEALRLRVARRGVAITLVSPGFVDTPMSQSLDEPRLFLITADRAAAIIARKIDRKAKRVVVPWQFSVIRTLTGFLPRALVRAVLARV